jgi:manganese transport protein
MRDVSEVAAMATDLAEFLGGAIGLSLLFYMPLFAGMVVTAIVTYAILTVQRYGFRPTEYLIGGLVGVIAVCYLLEMFIAPVEWSSVALYSLVPQMPNAEALTISVCIAACYLPAFRADSRPRGWAQ